MNLLPESKETIEKIYGLEKVKKALDQIVLQEPYTIEEQIEICEMPAPPMKETNRGELIRDKIKSYGLKAEMDPVGNVIARYKGTDPEAPVCAVAAHIDTVFADNVDVTVRRKGGKLYAPGIACNARGVACMLQVIRSLVSNQIRTKGDIIFIGTVGEEAEGDLRGIKRIFNTSGMHIDGMLALESSDPGRLLWGSTGSKRYKIEFLGPGGHSFLDFGDSPSATQALCRAGAMLADLEVPENPKTTFSIGPIKGGTTVNSIAEHAQCEIDLRSQDNDELTNLVDQALPLFAQGANLENSRWHIEDEDMKV